MSKQDNYFYLVLSHLMSGSIWFSLLPKIDKPKTEGVCSCARETNLNRSRLHRHAYDFHVGTKTNT